MNAPYRMPDAAGDQELSPEDEMRLILAKADESPLKRMLFLRALMFVLSTACVVYGGLEGIFWVTFDAVFLVWIVYDLTRRMRLTRRLKNEGIAVPASFRT